MKSPRRGKTGHLNAFALATLSSSVRAEVTVENVLAARPDWTRELAMQFLRSHGQVIAEAMELAGTDALFDILPRSPDAN